MTLLSAFVSAVVVPSEGASVSVGGSDQTV